MPVFEYKCVSCGKVFDFLHLAGRDEKPLECPECGGKDLTKLISRPFLPSSVGKPANADTACCGSNAKDQGCTPGSCCAGCGH